MFLATVAASGSKIGIGEAAITAVLGYAVVFVGLAMLMVVTIIMGKIMQSAKAKKAVPAPAAPAGRSRSRSRARHRRQAEALRHPRPRRRHDHGHRGQQDG